MSGFDWGAYIDGSVSPEERETIESKLQSCDITRSDFEAFKDFRAAIRRAALAEGIPDRRLESMLREISSRNQRSPSWFLRFAPMVAVLAALAFFALKPRDQALSMAKHPKAFAQLLTSQPEEAADWVLAKTSMKTPVLRLSGVAKIVSVQFGSGWACYDYNAQGELVCIQMTEDDTPLSGSKRESIKGTTVYVDKALSWKSGRFTFHLNGGSEALRREIARAAIDEAMSPAASRWAIAFRPVL